MISGSRQTIVAFMTITLWHIFLGGWKLGANPQQFSFQNLKWLEIVAGGEFRAAGGGEPGLGADYFRKFSKNDL
jgi:hypothetical protein